MAMRGNAATISSEDEAGRQLGLMPFWRRENGLSGGHSGPLGQSGYWFGLLA